MAAHGCSGYAVAAPCPGATSQRQNSEPHTPALQVYARNVLLDVIVTDSSGRVVRNLGKDDFDVLENGRSQPVVSVEPPGSHVLTSGAKIHNTAELDSLAPFTPVTILALDEINTTFEDMAFARYSLRKYLDSQAASLQQPAMLVSVNLQRVQVLQEYTQDKNALLSALEAHLSEYPWHLNSSWRREQLSAAFGALAQVASASAGHRAQKNLVWVGHGFPSIDPVTLSAKAQQELQQATRTCVNMLTEARITLYTIDPAGVASATASDPGEGSDIDPFGGSVQFNAIAQATGGKSFFGRNDVTAEIAGSIHEGGSFYVVAYKPSLGADDKSFRNVHVRLRRPGLTASTREGYYITEGDQTQPPQGNVAGSSNHAALFAAERATLIYEGLPLKLRRDDSDSGKIVVELPAAVIPWTESAEGVPFANLEVLIATFDRRDKVLAQTAKDISIRHPAAREGSGQPSNIYLHLGLPNNRTATRLRVVVRLADSGKIGAANLSLRGSP